MALRCIILPQTLRVGLPPIANFAIGLLKDTSLASAVAAPELSFQAHMLADRTFLTAQYLCSRRRILPSYEFATFGII